MKMAIFRKFSYRILCINNNIDCLTEHQSLSYMLVAENKCEVYLNVVVRNQMEHNEIYPGASFISSP